jgi:ABC-type multidrug transport system fused ATPase/permease subunit
MTQGTVSGERILAMMRTEPEVKTLPGAVSAPSFKGEIRFEKVSYRFQQGSPVLQNINLKIEPGERVAISGPTGSGKTTLVSLIPRFYDPSSGRVMIDGKDVKAYTLASLRGQISFVFQEPILFATTIAENIAYGKPGASLEEIIAAAEKARIHQIIDALPEGYETVVGERGCTLSGGQRQCVAIARAAIRNAPIVILDEPTSGLDPSSTKQVMEALQELLRGRTVILISHQDEPLRNVDRTIRLRQGAIDEESFVESSQCR